MREVQNLGKRSEGIDPRYGTHRTATYSLFECPHCLKQYEIKRSRGLKQDSCVSCKGIRQITHGMSRTKFYNVWRGMIQRCTNPNNRKYHIYGGKGVRVCDRWMTFENFQEDNLHLYAEGLTIDRQDSSGNYEPGNCVWISLSENSAKTSKVRSVIQYEPRKHPEPHLFEIRSWASAKEAADSLNLVAAHITVVCQGKRNTHGGFAWAYAD